MQLEATLSQALADKYGLDINVDIEIRNGAVYSTFGLASDPSDEVVVTDDPGEPERQALTINLASENPNVYVRKMSRLARDTFRKKQKDEEMVAYAVAYAEPGGSQWGYSAMVFGMGRSESSAKRDAKKYVDPEDRDAVEDADESVAGGKFVVVELSRGAKRIVNGGRNECVVTVSGNVEFS